ncbi:GNAT family N-acetyltransferase [Micromonospora robiginosa]|uniref:GNAT family N-acetyltransferase n=1 Tax=Micromonospora robiginosa TaxID=2749844 RepID=A0A7L6B0G1_9ACTN|nr:GNAT family N-acetyltransferase [Micromonospora ferruginea]QLQ35427.1 GNAT family N-acetyltransferase [Micromonospora ferruginea]
MAADPLLARARAAWLGLAGTPMAFPAAGGVEVAASAGSLLCPPGWVGIMRLGDAAVVTVPSDGLVGTVREALRRLPVAELTDAGRLRALLPVAGVLGPASLAYVDENRFRPATSDEVGVVPGEAADLTALLASVPADDADECGLADVTSRAFVVRHGDQVVAAAGYRRWPGRVAHLCVLTRADRRGRGLACAVASAAVADALTNGLLPQWRARPEPSRRVARALGFRQLGAQLSLALTGE